MRMWAVGRVRGKAGARRKVTMPAERGRGHKAAPTAGAWPENLSIHEGLKTVRAYYEQIEADHWLHGFFQSAPHAGRRISSSQATVGA